MNIKVDNKLVVSSLLLFIMIIVGIKQFNLTPKLKPKTNSTEQTDIKLKITINDKKYSATILNNETAKEIINMLPLEIEMQELNGNEKYYNIDKKIKSNPTKIKKINKGDIMLFNDDTLVIFYDTFDTTYKYTKIGSIDNPDDLDLTNENVTVKIEK